MFFLLIFSFLICSRRLCFSTILIFFSVSVSYSYPRTSPRLTYPYLKTRLTFAFALTSTSTCAVPNRVPVLLSISISSSFSQTSIKAFSPDLASIHPSSRLPPSAFPPPLFVSIPISYLLASLFLALSCLV